MIRENAPLNDGGYEGLPPQELNAFTAKVMNLTGFLQTFADTDLSAVKDKKKMKNALTDLIAECEQDILPKLTQIRLSAVKKRFQQIWDETKRKLSELERYEKEN